jgi:hypothetical protein
MKKLFGLLAFTLFLSGCDDGDLTVENIDFTTVTGEHCGNIVYKLKDTEALFFEVESYDAAFKNDATPAGLPIILEINDDNRIFYRSYNGTVGDDNICETVQPGTPNILEEWTITGENGTIEITTTPVIVANTATGFEGGEKIERYRHSIVFRNVYLNAPGGTEFRDLYDEFGDYVTTANVLPFNFDDQLDKCGNLVTNTNGSEGITLDIDPALIVNAATPAGMPRTGLIGATTNKLLYTLFESQVTAAYFCTTPTPATPIVKEQWMADEGVSGISGIIEVTPIESGPGVFIHEIHLKKVTLRRGNSSFLLADDYMLGLLTTN